jgi:hypothetical protein
MGVPLAIDLASLALMTAAALVIRAFMSPIDLPNRRVSVADGK